VPKPSSPDRPVIIAGAVLAAATLIVAGVMVGAHLTSEEPGPPTTTTGPGTTTTPPPAAELPPLPDWGPVAGVPGELSVPPGGEVTARETAVGTAFTITRDDGTRMAQAEVDDAGVYRQVHYFDDRGRLELAIDRVDVLPPGSAAGAGAGSRDGCRNVSTQAGFHWTSLPIPWRLNARSVPRPLGASRVLGVARTARTVWARNSNRCRVRDASRASFAYRGTTARGIGRNGVNSIGFGEINDLGGACVGAVACTFTWTNGNRAIESDIRIDKNHRGGYAVGARPGGRLDLLSVLVHETGHTLGLDHVNDASNVMFPFIRAGTTTYRRLGRGDALANNALY